MKKIYFVLMEKETCKSNWLSIFSDDDLTDEEKRTGNTFGYKIFNINNIKDFLLKNKHCKIYENELDLLDDETKNFLITKLKLKFSKF